MPFYLSHHRGCCEWFVHFICSLLVFRWSILFILSVFGCTCVCRYYQYTAAWWVADDCYITIFMPMSIWYSLSCVHLVHSATSAMEMTFLRWLCWQLLSTLHYHCLSMPLLLFLFFSHSLFSVSPSLKYWRDTFLHQVCEFIVFWHLVEIYYNTMCKLCFAVSDVLMWISQSKIAGRRLLPSLLWCCKRGILPVKSCATYSQSMIWKKKAVGTSQTRFT